jgi:hypothetical protein
MHRYQLSLLQTSGRFGATRQQIESQHRGEQIGTGITDRGRGVVGDRVADRIILIFARRNRWRSTRRCCSRSFRAGSPRLCAVFTSRTWRAGAKYGSINFVGDPVTVPEDCQLNTREHAGHVVNSSQVVLDYCRTDSEPLSDLLVSESKYH